MPPSPCSKRVARGPRCPAGIESSTGNFLVLSPFRCRRTPEPQGFLAMAKHTSEQIVQDRTTEAIARSGEAANEMIKGNVDALAETGNASRAAVQELTKAYQEL